MQILLLERIIMQLRLIHLKLPLVEMFLMIGLLERIHQR